MAPISYRRHRFPPVVIQHAVWLYLRFTLSYRDVEELLAERGLDLSYESVRIFDEIFEIVRGGEHSFVPGRDDVAEAETNAAYRKAGSEPAALRDDADIAGQSSDRGNRSVHRDHPAARSLHRLARPRRCHG
jgi:hypothetical protein